MVLLLVVKGFLVSRSLQAQLAARMQTDMPELNFFVLSDVWLDRPDTLLGLRKMLDNCVENSFIPKVFVLCGNFSSRGIPQGNALEIRRYQGTTPPLRSAAMPDRPF